MNAFVFCIKMSEGAGDDSPGKYMGPKVERSKVQFVKSKVSNLKHKGASNIGLTARQVLGALMKAPDDKVSV